MLALTSRCEITPESAEGALVDGELEVRRAAKQLEIRLPLLVGLNWENLFESANPGGALSPSLARTSLTREAIRRKELRRRSMRAGLTGLLAAVRSCS